MIVGAGARAFKYVDKELRQTNTDIYALSREECDVTDLEKLFMVTKQIDPQVVINLSAYTNTYAPETDKSEYAKCYKINAIGPKNLALVTKRPIIHISTNYVYKNGLDTYKESDVQFIGPESSYGMHKLIGEEYLRRLSSRHFILRTQWLFGKGEQNFLSKLTTGELNSQELDDTSYGIPTSYGTLAKLIRACTEAIIGNTLEAGIYNAVNSGSAITIHQLAQKIGAGHLHKIKKNDTINRVISVPLNNQKIKDSLKIEIPTYLECIENE
jgi:dTDP-4-dehydrorhamnose reductase